MWIIARLGFCPGLWMHLFRIASGGLICEPFLHADFLAVCPAYAVLAGLLSLQALIWHFTAVYMLTCVFYRL